MKPGDVVQVRSGGPRMTVEVLGAYPGQAQAERYTNPVTCIYWVPPNDFRCATFEAAVLRLSDVTP
jgi:hypothetical protein